MKGTLTPSFMNLKNALKNDQTLFSDLVDMESPQNIFEEAVTIVKKMFPDFDFAKFTRSFEDIIRLFEGDYPGYQKCNILYHDLKHTTDVLLAMIRLVHGALLDKKKISREHINLALLSALFHDTGYIQEKDDTSASGAIYTITHVERSITFMKLYFEKNKFSDEDFKNCRDMIRCTDLSVIPNTIKFSSPDIKFLGKMLGTADVLGQMADRTYLEKLLYLYYEFKEGEIRNYSNELDLLEKTLGFYNLIKNRMITDLSNVQAHYVVHFSDRWNMNENMYETAIKKNMDYLQYIVQNFSSEYRNHLKRGGIVDKLKSDKLDS
jgi:hypothetical protein